MQRTVLYGSALILMAATLGGCAETRRALGIEKSPPDEFAVVSGSPLALPPDYTLRPPLSPSDKPAAETTAQQARQTVFRIKEAPKPVAALPADDPRSSGERALLAKAGATNADPSVRQQVDQETAQLEARDRGFIDTLLFWQDKPKADETVDAVKEAQRLNENAALGKSVTAGETPQIERKRRAILEGLF
jgi:hypothetical protein